MASYLGDKKSLMPDIVVPDEEQKISEDIFIENIEMNDFVLQKYSEERKKELEMDKRGKKMAQLQNKESFSSSYRIFQEVLVILYFQMILKAQCRMEIY